MNTGTAAALAAALLSLLAIDSAGATEATGAALPEPPPAKVGECWVPVLQPAEYDTVNETVELAPARERTVTVPARYEWRETVVDLPAGTRRVVVRPAEVAIREERVLVKPVDEVRRTRPARTRIETRRVVTATAPALKASPENGALCVVDVPTAWRDDTRTVIVAPARSEWVERPARYRTMRHRTVIRPAETALLAVPAHRETRRERVLVAAATTRTETVPAVTAPRMRQVLRRPAQAEWRAVLCGSNATPARVAAIQRALLRQGQDPGRSDGRFVTATATAMRDWERNAGLPALGFTVDALDRLGVSTDAAADR